MPATNVSTDYKSIPPGDHVSEGLSIVMPDACFPNMVIGDKANHPWPYLRREINHNWYCDRRAPLIGFLNRDEAILLHNLALPFRNKPALEIGSWMGWSTCHLALAGVVLDVIDPILADPEHLKSVRESLSAAGHLENVRLLASSSPEGVRDLAKLTGVKWNFFFIDGDHEGEAPARDAAECLKHAAQDAMIVFHDLTSPDVEEGLQFLWRRGWNVLIYQTMQIMAVAWRGAIKPVCHKADPSIAWTLPSHLAKYPVSGASPEEEVRRMSHEIAWREGEIARLRGEFELLNASLEGIKAEAAVQDDELVALRSALASRNNDVTALQIQMVDRAAADESRFRNSVAELARVNSVLLSTEADLAVRTSDLSRLESEVAEGTARLIEATSELHLLHTILEDRDADLKAQEEYTALLMGQIELQEAHTHAFASDRVRFHNELSQQQVELQSREIEIDRLRSQVASQGDEIRGAIIEFNRVSSLLSEREDDLIRYQGQIAEKNTEIQRLTLEVDRFSLQSERLFSEANEIRFAYQSLLDSRSWKVTHPIRKARASRVGQQINALFLRKLPRNTEPFQRIESSGNIMIADYKSDQNALFDSSYYCEMNADVVQAGLDPLLHYLSHGAAEGRDPNPLFDTSFYLDMNPDVADSGFNPFLHYISHGASEGRDPHPLFDTSFYCEANPIVMKTGVNPLLHFLKQGATEGRNPHPLFDTNFYHYGNPEVAQAGTNPLIHYIRRGASEDRDPHPLFDTSFYCEMNPDVAQAGINPLAHFVIQGAAEGRDPHPLFDTSFYYEMNPDVELAGLNPLTHYLMKGASEGRDPHPLFDTSYHVEMNPDVAQAGINPLLHYLTYGAVEDRDPHPMFDTSFYREQKPHIRSLGVNPLLHFLKDGPTPEFDPLSQPPDFPDTGICIVTPDIVGPVKNGGIGTACYHFARVLAEAGQSVTVVFTADLTECQKAHWRNVFARMHIKFVPIGDIPLAGKQIYGSTWFLERSWRVFEYLRRSHYSIIHFQDWHANGFWSIKAKQVGLGFAETAMTVMTHSCTKWINEGMQQFAADPFENAKLVWAETYCMEHCDILLSPSQHMFSWLQQNQIQAPARKLLTPYVWSDGTQTPAVENSSCNNEHLIFFGRLETRKGLHIFGEALRRLQRKNISMPRIVSFLGKHGLVQGRKSSEFIDDLRVQLAPVEIRVINDFDYMRAMQYIRQTQGLVVIPSILDNYPLTVMECVQSGIPFVAAATGGIPEMIDSRVSFQADPGSLADCLENRGSIDHRQLKHKYSAQLAAEIWQKLHSDLISISDSPFGSISERESKLPTVSVCIPFFNHQRYLETLVTSFKRQRYPSFEVVLVNDGSSREASEEFHRLASASRDVRFRFIKTENLGPGGARNLAVKHSSGELLVFFDADNLPKNEDFIQTMVRAIHQSNADCVTSPYDMVDADRIEITEEDVEATYRPIGSCVDAGFFENLLGDTTMIIRRSVFDKLHGFPTHRESSENFKPSPEDKKSAVRLSGQQSTWEDHEFLLNLCFRGFKLETFPEALFYYRQSPRASNQPANLFRNYQSLFARLNEAPSETLARILTTVGGPMLIGKLGGLPEA